MLLTSTFQIRFGHSAFHIPYFRSHFSGIFFSVRRCDSFLLRQPTLVIFSLFFILFLILVLTLTPHARTHALARSITYSGRSQILLSRISIFSPRMIYVKTSAYADDLTGITSKESVCSPRCWRNANSPYVAGGAGPYRD